MGLSVQHGVGEVAVNLAEVFFLSVGEDGFAAAGGESEEQREVDGRTGRGCDGSDAGEFGFAGEPEDEGCSDSEEEASNGGEESEDGERGGKVHVAGEGGGHGHGSGKKTGWGIVGVRIDFVGDPIILKDDGEERTENKKSDACTAAGCAGREKLDEKFGEVGGAITKVGKKSEDQEGLE